MAVGELVSLFNSYKPSGYTGPVQLLNGEFDGVLCPGAHCTPKGSPATSHNLFPRSSNFTTFVTPNTNHCVNLHYSAPITFKAAHDFIKANVN